MGMSIFLITPYVVKISVKCSFVTFRLSLPIKTRAILVSVFSSRFAFLFGLADFERDFLVVSPFFLADLGEPLDDLLEERLERELCDDELDPERDPELLELPELELLLLDFGIPILLC